MTAKQKNYLDRLSRKSIWHIIMDSVCLLILLALTLGCAWLPLNAALPWTPIIHTTAIIILIANVLIQMGNLASNIEELKAYKKLQRQENSTPNTISI